METTNTTDALTQFRARADIVRQNLADPKREFFLRQADFGAKFFRHARID